MKIDLFIKISASVVFLLVCSSCTEEPIGNSSVEQGGHTLALRLATTVSPISETKAVVAPARVGSEAAAAGFSYELVSSDTDTTSTLATKAPLTLKNVYALLFTSAGAFNGRASIGTVTVGSAIDITFTNVVTPTASNCRLVIVANDNAATTSYSSSGGTGGFASFSGTYAAFQVLKMTQTVANDADIPYAGSSTVNLPLDETGSITSVSLYRALAKITLSNTFSITNGPSRSSITLYSAGERRFATSGSDNYDGSGATQTTAFVATTSGSNSNSNVWYVGENIRPAGSGIFSSADRNRSKAPANACYIRIGSGISSVGNTPSVGEEYIVANGSFTYDIYLGKGSVLSDFSLRRHMNYTITSSVSGTLAKQQELSLSDGRIILTKTGSEGAGLCIGMFGGASGYTTGTGPTISGRYTKNLLLQPNTSGTTAEDDVSKQWCAVDGLFQPETRKYWDPVYTIGTFSYSQADFAINYCMYLDVAGVRGWYLPTQAQLMAIWGVFRGLQGNSAFANYSAFNASSYWNSTEFDTDYAWYVNFRNGDVLYTNNLKTNTNRVRCVRDI